MRILTLFVLCSVVVIAACEGERQPAGSPSDSTVVVPLPLQGERPKGFDPGNVENFERVVFKEYAHLAVGLSKRRMDSIMESTHPTKIEEVMTRELHRQDSSARRALASKYGITIDSVSAILAKEELKAKVDTPSTAK